MSLLQECIALRDAEKTMKEVRDMELAKRFRLQKRKAKARRDGKRFLNM